MSDPAPGANALLTLTQLKAYINESGSTLDALLVLVIDGVSDVFNGITGRMLAKTTWTSRAINGSGSRYLYLPDYPVVGSITGIVESDEDGNTVSYTSSDFTLISTNDYAFLLKVVGVWRRGYLNETLTFVAGFDVAGTSPTIPGDLKFAALEQTAFEWKKAQQKDWGVTSKTFPDGSITKENVTELLPQVKAIINRYRRMTL